MSFCGNCGASLQPSDKFCGECGARVDSAPSVSPQLKNQLAPEAPAPFAAATPQLAPEAPAPFAAATPQLAPEMPAPSAAVTTQLAPEMQAPSAAVTTQLAPEMQAPSAAVTTRLAPEMQASSAAVTARLVPESQAAFSDETKPQAAIAEDPRADSGASKSPKRVSLELEYNDSRSKVQNLVKEDAPFGAKASESSAPFGSEKANAPVAKMSIDSLPVFGAGAAAMSAVDYDSEAETASASAKDMKVESKPAAVTLQKEKKSGTASGPFHGGESVAPASPSSLRGGENVALSSPSSLRGGENATLSSPSPLRGGENATLSSPSPLRGGTISSRKGDEDGLEDKSSSQATGGILNNDEVKSYIIFSAINSLCCCMPLGLLALVFSIVSRVQRNNGDIDNAVKYGAWAKTINIVALVCGIIIYVLALIVGLTSEG